MSLWFRRKDKDGKTHIYLVPCEPLVLIALVGILMAILLPIVQVLRAWVGG